MAPTPAHMARMMSSAKRKACDPMASDAELRDLLKSSEPDVVATAADRLQARQRAFENAKA